jgi:hypothetical protein
VPDSRSAVPSPSRGLLVGTRAESSTEELRPAPLLRVRDDLCLARVWASGHGAQCSRRRLEGIVFCAQHRVRQPHGRVDNRVLLPTEARRVEAHAARVRRDVAGGRWYSRVQMLAEARKLGLDGVDALSDAQFETACMNT